MTTTAGHIESGPSPASAPLPPGPRGLAAIEAWRGFLRDPYLYPGEITKKYGDVVSLPIPGADIVLLGSLEHINHVAVANAANYKRSDWVAAEMKPVEHLHRFFAFDDTDWERGRKLMKPHLTKKSLLDLESLFDEAISEQLDRWEQYADTGETVDLQRRMKVLTVAVLFNALFSRRLTEARLQWIIDRLTDIMAATTVRTLMWSMPSAIPRAKERRGIRAQRELDLFLTDIIAERRANPTDRGDILNVLLGSTYEDGRPLEDEKLLAEMVGLVIGGFDTTSAALTWTFGQIATHRDVEEKLLYELGSADSEHFSPSESSNLAYARACFDEAQRLQGGLIINPKVAVDHDVIGGFHIRPGTTVVSSNISIHRDERYWDAPADYRPDRWLERAVRRDAYIPFGRGARLCLGMHMAYIEGTHTVAAAFSRYRFTVDRNHRLRPKYRMVVEMKDGLPVTIARR
ncbi:cytochrome P450 [Nocardia africana]|uniref:Cytochrome P450(BM-3) n=1 Tax=Nocardia africana TaxID=134964 RepID=A0A378X182_9NOCA|nr:cytochrome P450 [Nocardia africana]MCC3312281.1 cytochrome P450 [Nocardia africana]SUA46411.1 Cytochrome P450(BM-3) [Nocardia africana]